MYFHFIFIYRPIFGGKRTEKTSQTETGKNELEDTEPLKNMNQIVSLVSRTETSI